MKTRSASRPKVAPPSLDSLGRERPLTFRVKPARGSQYRYEIIGRNGEPMVISEPLRRLVDAEASVDAIIKAVESGEYVREVLGRRGPKEAP